jgi:hypothetical protein
MTQPSERLDELLENWHAGQYDQQIRVGSRLPSLPQSNGHAPAGTPVSSTQPEEDGELQGLLETAQRVEALPTLRPDAAFSQRLGQQLQARAAALRADGRRHSQARLTVVQGARPRRFALWSGLRLHPGLSAAVMMLAVLGLLGVIGVVGAQASNPSNPFYQVKLFEQSIQLSLASPADRVRLHIGYARDDLQALQRDGTTGDVANYEQALGYLGQETGQAESALADVPAGAEHDQLVQMLNALTGDEQQTLRGLLKQLPMLERLNTTTALKSLGAPVPVISTVTVTLGDSGRASVEIRGTGFEPGAALLVNGQPTFAALTVTATKVTATLTLPPGMGSAQFGVANPDGTAAQSGQVVLNGGTPTAQPSGEPTGEPTHKPGDGPTPTPGGDGQATPTPGTKPSETPGPNH